MRQVAFAAAAAIGLSGLAACEARQTQEGELPEVSAEGGQIPKYDVDPTVDVEMREKTVTVPDVDIPTEERKVEVPVVTDE